MAELQKKVRELGARRTLNQRRVSDYNLSSRREAERQRVVNEAPSPRRMDAHGRPCNPAAWYALYMRVSGSAQLDRPTVSFLGGMGR